MTFLRKTSTGGLRLHDHGGGFDVNHRNKELDEIADTPQKILIEYSLQDLSYKYSNIEFVFDFDYRKQILEKFRDYNIHPELTFRNFVCSFNGSPHVSRKLLVSILEKFGWFDPTYCSKNFSYNSSTIEGHVADYTDNPLYEKFFVNSEGFNQSVYTFGHNREEHNKNIYNLEQQLTGSFLHVVSETMATSYYPFVTEKFLYSVVTRGLFLAYAQPGWHEHLEKRFGFKKYTKLFDYSFDNIQNPVERLVELVTMLSKFSVLSSGDWTDLYLLEQDTIEYNYNHYFSGDYLVDLRKL